LSTPFFRNRWPTSCTVILVRWMVYDSVSGATLHFSFPSQFGGRQASGLQTHVPDVVLMIFFSPFAAIAYTSSSQSNLHATNQTQLYYTIPHTLYIILHKAIPLLFSFPDAVVYALDGFFVRSVYQCFTCLYCKCAS